MTDRACVTLLTLLFFFFKLYLYYVYQCIFACTCVCATHVCSAHEGQNKVLDPLKLELQLSATRWMLGTKSMHRARAAKALNHSNPKI